MRVHGWLVLDKPRGLGSTQAVGKVKRVLRAGGHGKVKVGHGGTLDPLAEGVLPIALGEATKLAGRMLDATKAYEFTIRFGEQTDTLDTEGAVVARSDARPSAGEVGAMLSRFTGPIEQMPPAYSALRIDGRRAHALARAGEEVELATRSVTVHELALLRHSREGGNPVGRQDQASLDPRLRGDDEERDDITLAATVSKGTYIRSLARDIALALGTVGHVTYLRRTRAGPFGQEKAISLDLLEEIGDGAPLRDLILPLEAGLDDIPALHLDPASAQAVRQGRVLTGMAQADGLWFAASDNGPVALMQLEGGTARVVRGFNTNDVAE